MKTDILDEYANKIDKLLNHSNNQKIIIYRVRKNDCHLQSKNCNS